MNSAFDGCARTELMGSHAAKVVARGDITGRIETSAGFAQNAGPGVNDKSSVETIFVVDDDYFAREQIASFLEDSGWNVDSFSSCEEFLAAHRVGSKTCLVLDLHFPGMSGLQLLRHMREGANNTPVIVLSGSSVIEEAVRSMKKGALDFIEKPVARDLLVASVERALAISVQSDEISLARNAAIEHLKGLTTRQTQILAQVLEGHPSKNIAADLGISQRTVENHRAEIMRRTGVRSLPALAQLVMTSRQAPGLA